MATFEELVAEALEAPFTGWDFSWLATRSRAGPLPWSYRREVSRLAAGAATMLDMGTGGGEMLSRLRPRPRLTVATEAWPSNVPLAASRLRPLGICVVRDEGASENWDQIGDRGRLPFRSGAFALVANRHEAFRAAEVARVLAPGGTFVTQQVDFHSYDDIYALLGLPAPGGPPTWLPLAVRQVRQAGLAVGRALSGEEVQEFRDIAGIVYYLRAVSWAVPGFSVESSRERLRAVHETPGMWPLIIRQRRFLLTAAKPPQADSRPGSAVRAGGPASG